MDKQLTYCIRMINEASGLNKEYLYLGGWSRADSVRLADMLAEIYPKDMVSIYYVGTEYSVLVRFGVLS